jgi:hypothetical protein
MKKMEEGSVGKREVLRGVGVGVGKVPLMNRATGGRPDFDAYCPLPRQQAG